MSMMEWAEKEVEIACKKERGNAPEGEWDYGCACYESALKAFKCLIEDGHSGMSIGFTKQILNRLIDGKPLTPIEDDEDVWNDVTCSIDEGVKRYQCNRMCSLFKYIYPDGTVKYSDTNRVICVDIDNNSTWRSGFIRDMVDEMFPITMPYSGGDPYKVYIQDCLYDPKNGDLDTIVIVYIKTPDCRIIYLNKYFKESDNGFVEINWDEYLARLKKSKERKES